MRTLNWASLNPRAVVELDLVMYAIVNNIIRLAILTAAMRHVLYAPVPFVAPSPQHVSEIPEST